MGGVMMDKEKFPDYLIIEKCLWYGDRRIEINHIDNDLEKPLDYDEAFRKLRSISEATQCRPEK